MTHLLFLPLLLLAFSLNAVGQRNQKPKKEREIVAEPENLSSDKKYLDLLMYYMDGDYEKCFKKSVNVTEDEESSKDALPFLYASMSLYEMSFLEQYLKDYPEALKESLKYAVKYRKKDERSSLKQGLPYLEYWEENRTYFDKLRKTTKEQAQKMLDEGKASKAEILYKQIIAVDPADYSTYYMLATLRLMENDTANASKLLSSFETEIKKVENLANEPEDRIKLLKYGFMEYSKFLINAGRTDVAKQTMAQLKTYLTADVEIENFIEEKKL